MHERQDSSGSVAAPSRVSPRLIALNVLLLGALVMVTFMGSRPATAQAPAGGAGVPGGQPIRGRGDYTMMAGKSTGGTASVVYIVDAANQDVIVLGWDRTNLRLNPIGHRSMADDAHYLTKPR